MKCSLPTTVLVALAAWLGGPAAAAQVPPADGSQTSRPEAAAPPRDAAVDPALAARWRALPPDGRAELRRRFDELRALPPAEREALVRRARELERLERDVLDELSAEQQSRLEAMPADARGRVLRELALDRARERAERLRAVVPAERLEALEGGDRTARERALGELRRQQERELPRHLRRFGEELGLPPREVERLAGLPPEVQRDELIELARRRLDRWVDRNGLPEGIDAEAWQRLRAAPPEVFARRYGRLREHFERQRGPGQGPGLGPEHGPRRAPPGIDAEAHAWLERLRTACQPTTEERLELAELPPELRSRALGERTRERALGVLRELGLDPVVIQRLESLPPGRLRGAAREAMHAHLGLPPPPEPPSPHRERRGR